MGAIPNILTQESHVDAPTVHETHPLFEAPVTNHPTGSANFILIIKS